MLKSGLDKVILQVCDDGGAGFSRSIRLDRKVRSLLDRFAKTPDDLLAIGTGEKVESAVDKLGPLGHVSQRDTHAVKKERFFLQSTAVSQHHRTAFDQIEHLNVSNRVDHMSP